ncbi:MAG: hypothetical protein ACI4DS_06280 [Eubacterium sp.]
MRKRIIIKRFFKVMVFIAIAAALFTKVFSVLDFEEDGNQMLYDSFAKEEKNTLDGIIVGNSAINRAWVAPIAWNEEGIAFYTLASGNQPLALATSIIDEARKTQDVDYVIVDIHQLRSTTFYAATAPSIRRVTDNMPALSLTRWKTVYKGLDYYKKSYTEIGKTSKLKNLDEMSFYLSFMQYHSRWEELEQDDFVEEYNQYKSAYTENKFFSIKPMEYPEMATEAKGLTDYQKEILKEVINYGIDNKIKILFISAPSVMEVYEQEELLEAFDIIESYDSEYIDNINFNTVSMYETLDINWDTDFYDVDHLNYDGAPKFTKYLANYIATNYALEDKRGNKEYSSWDEAYNAYIELRASKVNSENTN